MPPDVVVDIGNTRVKWGRCARGRVAEVAAFGHDDPVGWKRQAELWGVADGAKWAVAGVAPSAVGRFTDWLAGRAAAVTHVTSDLFDDGPMDIVTRVDEPDRIGVDRLLGSLAAFARTPEGASAVAVAVGTAMTVDFVTADGEHVGGAILPGPALMARSLHQHTAKLPRVEIDPAVPVRAWGENTEEAIELGIASAVLGAADQLVWDWAAGRPEPPWVYVTGGDAGYFRGFAFTADVGGLVIDPALTLDGLRLAGGPAVSDTRVSVLTPAGAGAVATVAVTGPRAWGVARWLFRPAGGRPLPDAPEPHRFWVGRLGDGDEVVLAVRAVAPEVRVEVHGHGGRRVVRQTVEAFTSRGCVEAPAAAGGAWDLLTRAPTLRTANVLLDQAHGAFDRAVRAALAALDAGQDARPLLAELARYLSVGRHLVEPWRVVVAGPPNVGKSSLVNALAGYQRSVVSPLPGTTRDVVTTTVAFDGWPVELADTAGLRDAAGLEAEGVERAKALLTRADLVVWVLDATAADPVTPDESMDAITQAVPFLWVLNKTDLGVTPGAAAFDHAIRASAATGDGIPGLVAAITQRFVPCPPPPGAAVPYTADQCERVHKAFAGLLFGHTAEAVRLLRPLADRSA